MKKKLVNIQRVGDFKDLLEKYDDDLFINFGSEKYGFEVSEVGCDGSSVVLISNALSKIIDAIDLRHQTQISEYEISNIYDLIILEEIETTIEHLDSNGYNVNVLSKEDKIKLLKDISDSSGFATAMQELAIVTDSLTKEAIRSKNI